MDIRDHSPEPIYEAVGRALSKWEEAEAELATLYATFLDKTFDFDTIYAFGQTGITVSHRLAQLEAAAERYFIRKPDQQNEGDVACLIDRARNLAKDRHRVAHGVVNETIAIVYDEGDTYSGSERRWLLQAPHYALRRLNFRRPWDYPRRTYYVARIAFIGWPTMQNKSV